MSYYETAEGKRVLDLENQITTLSANIYAAEYRWLCLLAQFDELEGWCGKGIKSFAHWLNWKCGISLTAGREKVRVARKLGELPLTSKAMSEGRLSYSKVRAITRIATAENEQDLLYIAKNGTAENLEKTVRLYREANPDNSPLSRRLARYSSSQRFRFPHKYNQYSLGHRKRCDNDYLSDPLTQW